MSGRSPAWTLRALLGRALALALLWWVLAEGDTSAWGVGLASVALATVASLRLWSPAGKSPRFRAQPSNDHRGLSPVGALAFAAWFLTESLKGGVQVARLAFQRRPDLAPALVDIPLALPPGPATVLLVNSLNLLPGTLSAGIDGRTLRLHVLDARLPVTGEVRAAEARIARMLGLAP
ncbi:MAG: Na+/H+ antiporter subunit E [Pseudomonadota bacterium]